MQALAGVTVLERAGPLSVAACAHLLGLLGARLVRIEDAAERARVAAASPAEARLRIDGKERLAVTPQDAAATWATRVCDADIVLLAPSRRQDTDHAVISALLADRPMRSIVCTLSLAGIDATDLPADASDALVQALSGLMAVTGPAQGAPEFARVPVGQLSAAVVATTAVLGALMRRDACGHGETIDLSLLEIMADQLRTHIGLVHTGITRGFRIGSGHPLCSPWNAYRARDGWILVCSSGDAHWHALLDLIGRPELRDDARYLTMQTRHEHVAEVDCLVQGWVGQHSVAAAIEILNAIDVPVGPALQASEVPLDPILRAAGTIQAASASAGTYSVHPWRFTAAAQPPAVAARRISSAADALPLAGLRVVEFTRYAAGPLAGYLLASLGAEVIKIESPGGEECRQWSPRFGAVSGYFLNYNAGKRCIAVDLRNPQACAEVASMIATADMVLHNMRPGAMERLGYGADVLLLRHPRLIYAAVSGFGPDGPQLPALDTVIQAHVGLTRLIGDGEAPLRIGYSIADQLAGHFLAAGVLAALRERARTGRGQRVEVAMTDAIAWLTHLAWVSGASALPATQRLSASDGWVVASAAAAACERLDAPRDATRDELVAALAQRGIAAAPVLEIDEVLRHPTLIARASLYEVATPGGTGPLFAAPLGMRIARPQSMAVLEELTATLFPPHTMANS